MAFEDPADKHGTIVRQITDMTALLFGNTCLCLLQRDGEPLNEGWKWSGTSQAGVSEPTSHGNILPPTPRRPSPPPRGCLRRLSHIWTPAGHASETNFSIPAIYCNALQMSPAVCMGVLKWRRLPRG